MNALAMPGLIHLPIATVKVKESLETNAARAADEVLYMGRRNQCPDHPVGTQRIRCQILQTKSELLLLPDVFLCPGKTRGLNHSK